MGCSRYMVTAIYIRPDRLFPKALKSVAGLGARLEYVDEEQRRIVADVPVSRLDELAEIAEEYSDYVVVEVKSSCKVSDEELPLLRESLKRLGFRLVAKGSSLVYTSVFEGRAVSVEVKGRRVSVKVGAKASSPPRPPIPPSIFALPPSEAREALGVLDKLLVALGLRG